MEMSYFQKWFVKVVFWGFIIFVEKKISNPIRLLWNCHITGIDTFVLEGSEKGANSMWNVSNLPWGGTSTNKRLFSQTIYKVNNSIFWIMSSKQIGSKYYTEVTPLLCQMVKIMSRKMWIMYGCSCHQAPHPFPSDTSQTLVTRCRRRVKTQQAP